MIRLLWCTANPEMFIETHKHWLDTAVHPEDITTSIAVDTKEHYEMLQGHDVIQVDNPRHGITTPLHFLTSNLEGSHNDIIIVPSDDFYSPQNWDMYIKEQYQEFDGVLKVNDGHIKDIVSLPVLSYQMLIELNRIIYHPAYNHMYSDKELNDIAIELKVLKEADFTHPEFEHRHYVYKKRKKLESDKRFDCNYDDMLQLYLRRKNLPLDMKLDLDEF